MAARGELQPEKLPPTERAAFYHCLRVHLQILTWETLGDVLLNPLEWGWKLDTSSLCPVMTDIEVAPSDILKFIRCKCKSETRRCESALCSCRRHGLKCVSSCGGCRGQSCANSEVL